MTFFPRFYTGDSVWSATVTLSKCRLKPDMMTERRMRGGGGDKRGGEGDGGDGDSCPITISVAPRRPPDVHDPKTRRRDCLADSDGAGGCSLNLFPEEDSWHYITVTPTRTERRVEFAINVKITGAEISLRMCTPTGFLLSTDFTFLQTALIRPARSTTFW